MRRIAPLCLVLASCLVLTLPGCVRHHGADAQNDSRPVVIADRARIAIPDSDTVRRVLGQQAAFAPLTPEPGDIWADLAFLKHNPPGGTQPLHPQVATRPPRQALPPSPVRLEQSKQTATTTLVPIRSARRLSAPPLSPEAPAASSISVQLAAVGSEQAARAEWQRLQRLVPRLIGGRVPSVQPTAADGHALWRLRTGGFATPAEASAFCTRLQAERSRCWVVARS